MNHELWLSKNQSTGFGVNWVGIALLGTTISLFIYLCVIYYGKLFLNDDVTTKFNPLE